MSSGVYVLQGKCPRGICPWGKCLAGTFSVVQLLFHTVQCIALILFIINELFLSKIIFKEWNIMGSNTKKVFGRYSLKTVRYFLTAMVVIFCTIH